MSASCLYRGTLRHRRFAPVEHAFSYDLFMVYLDLDELPEVLERHPAWSSRRPALAWFRRQDHFGAREQSLSSCVRDLVEARSGRRPKGPIRLLTHLRYFGLVFNPVSFYYCFDERGERLEVVVAEVDNTPWGERHLYVLPAWEAAGDKLAFQFDKEFHVSPFMAMDQKYDWTFTRPASSLVTHMKNIEGGRAVFDATLVLRREPLSRESMGRVIRLHPVMTAKVLFAIYANAFRLWRKRAPFFAHPERSPG